MPANSLSELPDRRWLLGELTRSLAEQEGGLTAIVVVNVERLLDYQIELGYDEGDELMAQVVERIAGCLRKSDLFARMSTSAFSAVLPGLRSPSQPLMAVSKIQRVCDEAFDFDGKALKVGLSFGVSLSPSDADDAEDLLRCADVALRHAQASGSGSALYSDCTDQAVVPVIAMEHDLESAIKASELDAHYQPIVDINTGEVTSVELLARWQSTSHGAIAPRVFVEMAEKCGLVMPLTLWTLNTGLREWAQWQAVLPSASVTINLSATVLSDSHLSDLVLRALRVWDIAIGQLTVDVTESAMMADPKACLAVLNELHDHGVKIAVDDFGTGYSSLAYLKDLPVSVLKIDDSFVTNMLNEAADRRIVQAVIDLAHNFDLKVIAEGVEDEETLDTLTLMGCEWAQGNQIALPMPSDQLGDWVAASDWDVAGDQSETVETYLSVSTPAVAASGPAVI